MPRAASRKPEFRAWDHSSATPHPTPGPKVPKTIGPCPCKSASHGEVDRPARSSSSHTGVRFRSATAAVNTPSISLWAIRAPVRQARHRLMWWLYSGPHGTVAICMETFRRREPPPWESGRFNRLDQPTVVTERVPTLANVRGQQRIDPAPLLFKEHPLPRRRHPVGAPRASPRLWETGSSRLNEESDGRSFRNRYQ